jgi:hypothetical protein
MQAIVEAALASVTIASQSVPESIRQAKPASHQAPMLL